MYVIGNLRELDGDKVYVTSFLCDRTGTIAGKYRKSHRLPYEDDIALGDDLPTFATDFGCIGMKIGTDHYFPEIDGVLRRRGASLVAWSTKPFPCRDEHTFSLAVQGRAQQNGLHLVVSQYAGCRASAAMPTLRDRVHTLGRAQSTPRFPHLADSGHDGESPRRPCRSSSAAVRGMAATTQKVGWSAFGARALCWAEARHPRRGHRVRAEYGPAAGQPDECGDEGDIVYLWE